MTSFSEITGVIDRTQNPDALLTDGSRQLTGNLAVTEGVTVDGVDISVLNANYLAHLASLTAHDYVSAILDDANQIVAKNGQNQTRIYGADGISVTKTVDGLRISGSGGGAGASDFAGIKDPSGAAAVPDALNFISLTASNQVSITAGTNSLAFALNPANIDHSDLGGLGADDHHAAFVGLKVGATTVAPDAADVVTLAAGSSRLSLAVAGSTITLDVSASPTFSALTVSGNIAVTGTVDGVDVSAHASRHQSGGADAIDHDLLTGFVADEHVAHGGVSVTAGAGMTGGGTIAASRTLNVGAGNGISVAADSVAVNQAYDFSWSGLHTFGDHTEMESVDVNGALNVFDELSVFYGGYYPLHVNVDTVNPNNSNVGIMTNSPDPQFALHVNGPAFAEYFIGPHALQLSDAAMICHFDGPPPYNTNFDGSAVGHLGQVPTITGDVQYKTGKFGKAAEVGLTTTNYTTNPSFESSATTGWIFYQSPTTAQSSDAYVGSYSLSMAVNATANPYAYISNAPVALATNQTWTFSAYVKAANAGAVGDSVSINLRENGDNAYLSTTTVALTSEWQRVSVTRTLTHAAPASIDRWIRLFSSTGGDAVLVDGVQLEQRAFASPYTDTSRSAGRLSYDIDIINADEGAVMMWIYQDSWNISGGMLWSAGDTNAEIDAYITNGGGLIFRENGNTVGGSSAGGIGLSEWVHVAFTWSVSGNTATSYINGVAVRTGTYSAAALGSSIGVGHSPALSTIYNHPGLIDDLVILSRAASADEIRAIYESNAPVFAETSVTAWRAPSQVPVWVDADGLWMRATSGGETLGAYGGMATKFWGGKTLYQSDFLLGNATDGYVHWHAFQDSGDPYGAAGMEIKAQVDITGDSSISGSLALTSGAYTRLFINADYLIAGKNAGSDATSFAVIFEDSTMVGTDPMSPTYDAGDVLIGDELAANILWDQSAGKMLFRDNTTVRAYVDTDGSIKAGGGAVTLDDGGFRLAVGTATPNRIRWMNAATERASINGFDSGGIATVSVLAGQNVATAYPGAVSLKASEGGGSLGYAELSLDGPGNQAYIQFADADGRFYVQQEGPTRWFEIGPTNAQFAGALTLAEITATPATPTSGAQMRAYMKADKFVIQYNDGGTVRYKYLSLTSTGVTWTHSTTAP